MRLGRWSVRRTIHLLDSSSRISHTHISSSNLHSLTDFIGGQVNVTGLLTGKSGLSFLIADPSDSRPDVSIGNSKSEEFGNGKYALSPSMQTYTRTEESGEGVTIHGGSVASGQISTHRGEMPSQAAGFFQPMVEASDTLEAVPQNRLLGLFRRKHAEKDSSQGLPGNQKLLGAEGQLGGPRSLDDQLKLFEATYSKLVVFKRDTRESEEYFLQFVKNSLASFNLMVFFFFGFTHDL